MCTTTLLVSNGAWGISGRQWTGRGVGVMGVGAVVGAVKILINNNYINYKIIIEKFCNDTTPRKLTWHLHISWCWDLHWCGCWCCCSSCRSPLFIYIIFNDYLWSVTISVVIKITVNIICATTKKRTYILSCWVQCWFHCGTWGLKLIVSLICTECIAWQGSNSGWNTCREMYISSNHSITDEATIKNTYSSIDLFSRTSRVPSTVVP